MKNTNNKLMVRIHFRLKKRLLVVFVLRFVTSSIEY